MPRQHEAHRAFQRERCERGENNLILRAQPGTEGAAHKGPHDAHIVRFHAEHAADIPLDVLYALGLLEIVSLPPGS